MHVVLRHLSSNQELPLCKHDKEHMLKLGHTLTSHTGPLLSGFEQFMCSACLYADTAVKAVWAVECVDTISSYTFLQASSAPWPCMWSEKTGYCWRGIKHVGTRSSDLSSVNTRWEKLSVNSPNSDFWFSQCTQIRQILQSHRTAAGDGCRPA